MLKTTANSSTGALIGELRYKAWGESRYSWGTPYTNRRYTGQLKESLLGGLEGLYNFNARWVEVYQGPSIWNFRKSKIMSLRIFISLSIIIIVGLIGILLAKPWELPETRIEKWKRSITIGLFSSLAMAIGLISYSLFDTNGKDLNVSVLWNILYPIMCCIPLVNAEWFTR